MWGRGAPGPAPPRGSARRGRGRGGGPGRGSGPRAAPAPAPARAARAAGGEGRRVAAPAQPGAERVADVGGSVELDALVPERVWQETQRALELPAPRRFFEVLREAHALAVIFPEVDALFGVPQPAQWHPEIDAGVHTMMVLDQACKLTADPVVRFAALTHDLGKASTPKDELPSHRMHDVRGVPIIEKLCDRLRVP